MRILIVVLALVVAGCGAGGSPDAANQYATAYNAFANTVNGSVAALTTSATQADLQAVLVTVGNSAATLTTSLQAISWPDKAKGDADTFTRDIVVVQSRAVAGSKMTGAALVAQMADIRTAVQQAAGDGAILRNDLGLPASS